MKFVEDREWNWSDVLELRRLREERIDGGRITTAALRKGLQVLVNEENYIYGFEERSFLDDEDR